MTSQNPGKPQELCGGDAPSADGSLRDFYTNCFSKKDAQIKQKPSDSTQFIYAKFLPDCTIGGNCVEEGVQETIMSDGTFVTRETGKFKNHNDVILNVNAKDSNFFQEGKGEKAFRRWTSRDGKEMFIRQGNHAEMHFGGRSGGQYDDNEYDFDIEKGTFRRQYDSWKVTQHTKPGEPTATLQDGDLEINVVALAAGKKTSLDFVDSSNQLSYHATKDGIEITSLDGKHKFLLVNNQLFKLAAAETDVPNADFFVDEKGQLFSKRLINNDEVKAAVGLDEDGGITIMGMKVYVSPDGKVTAQTTAGDGLTIEIGPDGSQTVTANDGYKTRVGPNGQMQVFGPDDKCLGFFDPFTGMLGNDHIMLAVDYSMLDGKLIDITAMVFENALLRYSQKQQEQADQSAVLAVKQSDANTSLVRKHLDEGTVDSNCFAALLTSMGELNNALSACLAAGARNNLSAIISALGLVSAQLTQSQAKFSSQKLAESMGVHDKFALAKVQKDMGTFSDPMANAKHVAEGVGANGQAYAHPTMAQHVNVA